MTVYHHIAIVWSCAVTGAAVAHWLLRKRWTRTLLAVLIAPLAGAFWAWGVLRRQTEPAGLEEPTNPEPPPRNLPPRRLPEAIATEDDYDSSSTLPPPGADSGAGDHDLARWLDERAASKAD